MNLYDKSATPVLFCETTDRFPVWCVAPMLHCGGRSSGASTYGEFLWTRHSSLLLTELLTRVVNRWLSDMGSHTLVWWSSHGGWLPLPFNYPTLSPRRYSWANQPRPHDAIQITLSRTVYYWKRALVRHTLWDSPSGNPYRSNQSTPFAWTTRDLFFSKQTLTRNVIFQSPAIFSFKRDYTPRAWFLSSFQVRRDNLFTFLAGVCAPFK